VTAPNAAIYNLMADVRISPQGYTTLVPKDWLATVDLDAGIANVIATFPDTLRADASFSNTSARAAWARVFDNTYSSISDETALLSRRKLDYQSDPALI
jgi:hypothetical protein